ncbi:MAG: hypothetical protein C0478_00360 [Planctomyces sp.]|nr:hypothetical protein [Planctomyces sp.]
MSFVQDDDDWWKKGKKPKDWSEDDDTYDAVDDEEPEFTTCPHCGAEVYEDSVQCAICGEYMTRRWSSATRNWWVYVIVGLLIATMFLWLFR